MPDKNAGRNSAAELDREEAAQKLAKFRPTTQEQELLRQQQVSVESEEDMMRSIIVELAKQPGWYSISEITARFNTKIPALRASSHHVSYLLKRLGYAKRKRLGHNKRVHVSIST